MVDVQHVLRPCMHHTSSLARLVLSWEKAHLQVLQGSQMQLMLVSACPVYRLLHCQQDFGSYLTGHSQAMGKLTQFVVQRAAQLNCSASALPGRVDWPSAPGLFCNSCCQGHCPKAAPRSSPCSAAGHAPKPSPYFALGGLAGAPQTPVTLILHSGMLTHGLKRTKDTCLVVTVQLVLFPYGST